MARTTRTVGLVVLSLLTLLTCTAFFLTRDSANPISKLRAKAKQTAQVPIVDESPLLTARNLRPFATTQEEDQLALEAIKQADHDVDLAYAMALRKAHLQAPVETPETKEITARIEGLEKLTSSEEAEIARLTKLLASADKTQSEILRDQLELLQAQNSLHDEELEDAHQDLIAAGGDNESAVQAKFQEHKTLQHSTATAGTESKPASFEPPAFLVAQVRTWQSLRTARAQLLQAQREADGRVPDLVARQQRLSLRLRDERRTITPGATGSAVLTGSRDQRGAALAAVRAHVDWRRVVSDFDKRIADEKQLSKLYGQWAEITNRQMWATFHALLRSVILILVITIAVIVAEIIIARQLKKASFDRRQLTTMRTALRVSLRAIGVLIGLIVLFGTPTQLSTIIAFAGAGLTVALKDFIVSFFGWFVLMGRNGLHVGDWVEINGIGGEVLEIGLLRTVLMETGNWSDAGHPTGRKVAFVNSFAMEGHYFNFTTKGQWLWDELNVLVLPDRDPYPLMAEIQCLITEETKASAELAEQEWKRATHGYGVQAFSAAPAINMRPTEHGINVVVRYVTQANERHELRTRLYRQIVELMRRPALATAAQ